MRVFGFLWHFTHLDCNLDQIANTNLDFHLCTVPHHHPCPRTSIVILEERFVQRVGIPRYLRRDKLECTLSTDGAIGVAATVLWFIIAAG